MEYANKMMVFKLTEDKKDWNFPSCYQFTTAGKQIWQHLNKEESKAFQNWLFDYLKKKGLEVVI
jgi:hypothetical protein